MSIPFQKFREIVFQLLYAQELSQGNENKLVALLAAELAVPKSVIQEALVKTKAVQSHLDEIDPLIAEASTSYAFERIHTVERTILRLGAYELLHDSNIPPKVAIAEAIRLTRKFASPEAANFINAVMDNIYRSSIGQKIEPQTALDALQQLSKSEEEIEAKEPLISIQKEQESDDENTCLPTE